jgi:hypothetical protein
MHKRSKGRVRGKSLSTALALLFFTAIGAPAGAGELYGLVVGIDDYVGTANDLDGAANDANDIAKSLTGAGAKEVVRLINDDASKDRIVAAWEGLVAKANPGDTIVFSYAGHGGQEPEPKGRHDEADGLNENFLLGRFVPVGPATRERILDDEVFGWMQEADKKGVKVVSSPILAIPAAWRGAPRLPACDFARWTPRPSRAINSSCRRRKSPSSPRTTSPMSPSSAPSPRTSSRRR